MALQIVQSTAEARVGNAASVTQTFGSTPVQGHLLVAVHRCDDVTAANINTPSGWTKGPQVVAAFGVTLFYKIAGASEPTSVTVTNVTAGPGCLMMSEYSGNDTNIATVLDTSTTTQVASGLTHTTSNLTIANAGDLIVVGIGLASAGTTTGWSNAWTNSFARAGTPISGNNSNLSCAYRVPGATGTYSTTETWTTNARTSRSVVAAFKAAAAGPVTSTATHSVDAVLGSVNYVQAAGEFRANSATTINGSFSQIPQQNNLLLIVHRCADGTASGQLAPPAGWSLAARQIGGPTVSIWYKIAGASEPTSITVTNAQSGFVGMYLYEYTNNVTANVVDKTVKGVTGGGVTTGTSPSLTTLNANDLIIVAFAHSSQTTWNNVWSNGFGRIGTPAAAGTSTLEVASKLVSTTGTYSTTETWADSGIGTMVVASFKALGLTTNTTSYDVDVSLLLRAAPTYSVDAVMRASMSNTYSADALKKVVGITRTHNIDAVLQKRTLKTHAVDAVARQTRTVTQQADGLLRKTTAATVLIEAILKATKTKTFNVDSILRKTFTKTYSVDATTIPQTNNVLQSVDAIFKQARTLTVNVDANVNALQSTFPQYNVDYITLKATPNTYSVNAVLLGHLVRTYATDASLLKRSPKTYSVDTVLRKVTPRTFSVDALLLGHVKKTVSVDASTLKTTLKTYSISAQVGTAESTNMYGAVPYGMPYWAVTNTWQVLHSVDAATFVPRKTTTVSVDARIIQAVGTQTVGYSADAISKKTFTTTYTTDARLSLASPRVYATDAVVKGLLTKTHTVSAVLQARRTSAYTVNGLLLKRVSATYSTDMLAKRVTLRAYGVDALRQLRRSTTYSVDSRLKKQFLATSFVDALFSKRGVTRSYSTDASFISETRTTNYSVDASFKHLVVRTHKVNATITFQKNPHGTWLDTSFPYRRALLIVAPLGGLPANHPVTATVALDKTVVRGKMRTNLSDVVIAYATEDTPREWIVLPAHVTSDGTNIIVNFPLAADLPDGVVTTTNYYIYYGNRTDQVFAATPASYVPSDWPVLVAYSDPGVSYTRPGEHWRTGISNVKHAKATLRFDGIKVRMIANTGPSYGIAEVQVDDNPWVDADLYSVGDQQAVEVFSMDLEAGRHVIRVRVSGRKNPSSTGTTVNIVRFEHKKAGIAIDIHEEIIELMWTSTLGSM